MDFFQHQEAARTRTAWLAFLFVLAVAGVVLAVYGVFAAVTGKVWDPAMFAMVSLGTVTVIALGSIYKTAQLSSGGETVALMLGGRRVEPHTTDLSERRLLNVVEEMALAAGMPVPPVFVLDHEASINAFAAGHDPQTAVIGVSRGSLEYLSRDELQGVMAHEFSHILNGDMRMNLRLMGILHGILLLAVLGYYILRFGPRTSDDSDKKGAGAAIALIGLGLLIIGWVGVFFARMIRSSVSRQREYLADASAVQFTRYPAGIAGALKKIGGLSTASRIRDAHAEECGHLFFGDAFAGSFFNLFATHPPLVQRIQRIEPTFDGTFPPTAPLVEMEAPGGAGPQVAEAELAEAASGLSGAPASPRRIPLGAADAVDRIGQLAPEQLSQAAGLIQRMPPRLAQTALYPFGARAVVFAVLLDREQQVRQRQLALLRGRVEAGCLRELTAVIPLVDGLPEEVRLPLVERTLPALKGLSPSQYASFREIVEQLVQADNQVSVTEYAVLAMVVRALDVHFGRVKPPGVRHASLDSVLGPAAVVLSRLAYVGSERDGDAPQAFQAGVAQLGRNAALLPDGQCGIAPFDAALGELAAAAPQVKRSFLAACAACVAADATVTVREAELLRAISSTLGCPMPPIG